jgi:hypothetical protein
LDFVLEGNGGWGGSMGFELGLALARQELCYLSHVPSPVEILRIN